MNPFPGLRPFTQEEDYLFFGREEQTLELLSRLGSHRFVAVVGTSGSGKSSLVRCGLLSELLGGKMRDAGASWEIAVAHPGGNPLGLLAEALLDAELYDRGQENTRENLLATLSRSHFGLVEAVKQAGLDEGTNFLLVVDQFEEIFRFHEAGQTQQEMANEFVSLLLEAVSQKEVPIYVVLTMRSDFIGECGQFEGLAEMVNRGEFLIPRLTREQFKRVIEGPVKVAGGRIAPRLLQRLLNDLGQQADQLPCLQHALMRTWNIWAEKGGGGALDLDDYQRVGRMSEALSLHADEVFDSLAGDRQRELCAGVFKALTVQESENRGLRRPQRLGRLGQVLDVPTDELLPIINAYRRHGVTFLMPSPEVELTDNTIIDISHESLMRVWTRLRHWALEEAQAAGIYLRLSESAALYKQGKTGLYRDPELGIALAWQESQKPNAAWAERYRPGIDVAMAFLAASREAAVADEQAREAARERELEQARQLAEAQRLRLEQQQRAAHRLRIMIAGLAVVALIAGLACVAALVARNEASRLANVAEQEADRAKQSQQETQNALAIVETQKAKAESAEKRSREFRYATDMQLAARLIDDKHANARQVLDLLAPHDPEINQELKGKDDLRGFEWYCLRRLVDSRAAIFPEGDQPVVDSTLTPEGELVTLDNDGRLRRWDAGTRRETRAALDLKRGRNLDSMALSVDGWRVALAFESKVHLLDTGTGEAVRPAIPALARFGLIFSPDNRMLVTVDETIGWWNAATGEQIATAEAGLSRPGPVSISSDGLTLVVGGQGDFQQLFSVFRMNPSARRVTVLLDKYFPDMRMRTAALSPDGSRLAASNFFLGDVVLFDTSTGQKLRSFDHAASVSAIGFNPRDNEMVTACLDGSMELWTNYQGRESTKTTASETTALMGHTKEVTRIAFALGGKQVISSSRDKTTRIWDLPQQTASIHRTVNGLTTVQARYSPDGVLIAAVEGRVRLRDAATARLVRELPGSVDRDLNPIIISGGSVAFSPDNRWLAVGSGGRNDVAHVELWDIDRGERLAVFPGTTDVPNFSTTAGRGIVSALCFSPDGKFLVAGFGSIGAASGPVKVYDIVTRRTIRLLSGHEQACNSVVFSADGSWMASGSYDGTARIWDTSTWETLHVLPNPDPPTPRGGGRVLDVAFSPAADLLAMASHEGNVHVWHAATGKPVVTLKGPVNGVGRVAFSPDGRTLAAGSLDQTVRLWNVATWREVLRLEPGVSPMPLSLAFSPDGTQLLAGGAPAMLWSTRPGDESQPGQTAQRLAALLDSKANFTSRILMISESLRLVEALEVLRRQRPDDTRVEGALAAARANRHASRQEWSQAAQAFDRLKVLPPHQPEAWFRTPGLLRLATALVHEDRPREAADLLTGGARRRIEDGVPAAALNDAATGEPLRPLRAAVNERLAQDPRNPGLLELRAELAGQWNDWQAQAADYTAAIKVLAEKPAQAATAHLRRLYRRRGDAYVSLQKWQEAVADYAHVLPPETADALLLANRARAHEGLKHWDAAAADWSRAATGNPEGARLLAEFARRLVAVGQGPLAKAQFEKGRALYERALEADPENRVRAGELAQLLLDDPAMAWTVLEPTEMKSKGGATLSKLADNSILASGKNPLGDAYTIVAPTKVTRISAIRLEALTDESLPNQGPGRDEQRDPGNFAMVNFTIRAHLPGMQPRLIEVSRVAADYFLLNLTPNQWNIGAGGASRPHTAFYLAKEPVDCRGDTRLEFEMQFSASAAWPRQNLGRFRLSVSSDPAALDREQKPFVAMKLNDPWARLGAAYHIVGDQQALDRLLAHHPAAAAGIGDLYAAAQDWERAIAEYRKVVTDQTVDGNLLTKLASAYESAGRTREAVPHFAKAYSGNPQDSMLLQKVAALQAWFGHDKELAATRQRAVAYAKVTNDVGTAERTAKVCSILPSADKAELEAALVLGRKAVRINKEFVWCRLAHGMAEYRSGNFATADKALLATAEVGNPLATGIASFFRAMSLFRQGKVEVARKLAIAAAVQMKPLPKDQNNPLAGAYYDDLILWLAYKEAMTLLKIKLSLIELLEQVRDDEVKTLGADHAVTLATTLKLAEAYVSSGRTREAVPILVMASSANPKNTELSLGVAARQAWFGQVKELAATRARILAFARRTNNWMVADRAAKACSILPSTNNAELEAALALGRTAVQLEKNEWTLLALGMAEYRSGNYAASDKALLAAAGAGPNNPPATAIAAFYRAMSLFRQGKVEEARQLAIAAAARMKPLPKDEKNPLAGDANHDDLIQWLAYKEAKALITFDAAPRPKAENDKK
jgi:WD40 repeat protein/tetratricopeptide (TPR) repeat protein